MWLKVCFTLLPLRLTPLLQPWGPLGQQASLGRLPFLVQHQLPTHAFVDAFMTNVQVTPDDVRGAHSRLP